MILSYNEPTYTLQKEVNIIEYRKTCGTSVNLNDLTPEQRNILHEGRRRYMERPSVNTVHAWWAELETIPNPIHNTPSGNWSVEESLVSEVLRDLRARYEYEMGISKHTSSDSSG